MRIPQVSERVKEAPAHALRAVFAGIGQLLLVTDRLKSNKPAEEDQVPRPRQPEPATPATPAAAPAPAKPSAPESPAAEAPAAVPAEDVPAAPKAPAATSAAPTGNVRLLPDADEAPAAAEPAAETPADSTPADSTPVVEAPAAEAAAEAAAVTPPEGTPIVEPAAPAAAEAPAAAKPPATAEAPIANYDTLTIASLRARLRGLTLVQVRELIVYEQANAARPDVIAMYERRVAKLEAPEG
jgi:hypothetical protein